MTLDDVINGGRIYHPANGFRGTYLNRTGDLKSAPSNQHLRTIVDQIFYELPEANRRMTYEGFTQNIGSLPLTILEKREVGRNALVTSTAPIYQEAVGAMNPDELMRAAVNIPGQDKPFYNIQRKIMDTAEILGLNPNHREVLDELNGEDINAIRTDYASVFPNTAWRAFITQQNDDFIRKYATMYLGDAINRFVSANFSRDGNLDEGRMRDYIRNTVDSYANDDDRNTAYFEIGKEFSATRI